MPNTPYQSAIDLAMTALKAAILINGGAAIAVLAFIGKVWNPKSQNDLIQPLSCSLLWFSGGVLLGGVCTVFAYISQTYFAFEAEDSPIGNRLRWICVVLGFISYICFVLGIWATYLAINL